MGGCWGGMLRGWRAMGLVALVALVGCRQPRTVSPVDWPTPPGFEASEAPPRVPSSPSLRPPATTLLPPPVASLPWRPPVPARAWRYIVLHHTASEADSVATIDAQHRKRVDGNGKPWLGIGYHFVIGNGRGMGDGEVRPTFRWLQQLHGAHAGSMNPQYNQLGIGIALVGNFENGPPTPRQREAARRLVQDLRQAYRISPDRVISHRDIRQTECPGRYFPFAEIAGRTLPPAYLSAALEPAPPVTQGSSWQGRGAASASAFPSRDSHQ